MVDYEGMTREQINYVRDLSRREALANSKAMLAIILLEAIEAGKPVDVSKALKDIYNLERGSLIKKSKKDKKVKKN